MPGSPRHSSKIIAAPPVDSSYLRGCRARPFRNQAGSAARYLARPAVPHSPNNPAQLLWCCKAARVWHCLLLRSHLVCYPTDRPITTILLYTEDADAHGSLLGKASHGTKRHRDSVEGDETAACHQEPPASSAPCGEESATAVCLVFLRPLRELWEAPLMIGSFQQEEEKGPPLLCSGGSSCIGVTHYPSNTSMRT